ncbi:RusA family crossover junction endodeoxyribonuclease [Lactobacillus taiwanensis]|uniref:RusA family crossover junction endodeoxyribonuclease n=1 Tax=Lactobacillus taiwanensis TaxID=508451 RepID=UPI00248C0A84|nr:RusA family crossover junction endodeoxyribonuclease [Lactobacillus taiwanensis]
MVPGQPVGQGRPRFTSRGRFPHAVDPPKSRQYKNLVKRLAHDAYQGEPLDGPIKIHLIHCFEIPKSYSKKRKKACLEGIERPTKKPDIDNVYKGVADAMSGIIYCDDKQVVEDIQEQWYALEPCVKVYITQI